MNSSAENQSVYMIFSLKPAFGLIYILQSSNWYVTNVLKSYYLTCISLIISECTISTVLYSSDMARIEGIDLSNTKMHSSFRTWQYTLSWLTTLQHILLWHGKGWRGWFIKYKAAQLLQDMTTYATYNSLPWRWDREVRDKRSGYKVAHLSQEM